MSLAVFENFLNFAERVVANKNGLPSAIDAADLESALVSYGVVLLHAHMEECLRRAVETRCRRCTDPQILTLALKAAKKDTGKIGFDALKDTLQKFGDAYKVTFRDHLAASGLGDNNNGSWVSVMNHRATVAHHGLPASCSLADLRLFYEDIRQILGFYCTALQLDAVEVTAISNLIILPAAPPAAAPPAAAPPAAAPPAAAPPAAAPNSPP